MQGFVALVSQGLEPKATMEELLQKYHQESENRFQTVVKERNIQLPEHGAWEVTLLLIGQIPLHAANREFLNLLEASNPNYTGWPVWLDSRGFTDSSARPYVFQSAWEAFIVSLGSDWNDDIDFMRLDPKGRFYLRRALEDDVSGRSRGLAPMKFLDFGLPVVRTAEAIAVGIAFAKAMGSAAEATQLAFAFRWTKLKGRRLASWANPGRFLPPMQSTAYQDEVLSFVNVPLETPLSALSNFVNQAVQPLFQVFDGFVLDRNVVEDLTRRLIERKL
jgi:hypothetical protein